MKQLKPMNLRQLICTVLVSSLAASTGYYCGVLRQAPASREAGFSVDDLYAPQSFSEVENAKALLLALSEQFKAEIYTERIANHAKAALDTEAGKPVVEPRLLEISQQLEGGVAEFSGTDQELVLVETLLRVLQKAKLYDRWTEVYLSALYQHPTDPMIGRLAAEAISVSKAAGREKDILNGFEHLSNIPMDFTVKSQVGAELVHAQTEGLVTAYSPRPSSR
jgi:hypothetical protein